MQRRPGTRCDRCVDAAHHPIAADPNLPVWVGVDASVKCDATAIVATTWDADAKKARLVWHHLQPRTSVGGTRKS